ncbi:MAG TPA: hypothetical protein VHB79_35195 [Polyangiaceae bacterium]|nr:hypothetical protein [Polyangiaceae bacterium]
MSYRNLVVGGICLGLVAVGCSSARDVEVSGKVTAPSTVTTGDKIAVQFLDVVGEGTDAKTELAQTAELKALGDFKQTVPLEGNEVIVRAIDDRDGNGKCTEGEAWGETQAKVTDDKAEAVSLALAVAKCPAEAAE